METLSGKIITSLLSLFLLLYVGYQGFRHFSTPIKTQTVLNYTVQDVEETKGLIVRNEAVMDQSAAGIVSYFNDDGVKVIKGTPVAEVYATREDVVNKRRVKELDEALAQFQSIQSPGNNYYLNSEAISKQINENLYALLASNESRDLTQAAAQKSQLLANLNKKQLATGVVDNFDLQIESLTREREQVAASISNDPQVITSEGVGYFSGYVDGLELLLNKEALDTLTAEEIEDYIDGKYEQDTEKLGKIIQQEPWYFLMLKPADSAEMIYEGMLIHVDFGITDYRSVPAKVLSIRENKESGQAIITLECDYMCPQLTRLRNPSVKLNYQVYDGLKIPDQAVRFRGDVRGVYVTSGDLIDFKTIDVIYDGTGFVLSRVDLLDPNRVQCYDEVVVSGILPEDVVAVPTADNNGKGDAQGGADNSGTS